MTIKNRLILGENLLYERVRFRKKRLAMYSFILLALFSCVYNVNAQSTQNDYYIQVIERSKTKDFKEIVEEVERYYANRDKGKGSGYKQFKRWEEFNKTRLTSDGKLFNMAAKRLDENKRYDKVRLKTASVSGSWTQLGAFSSTTVGRGYSNGLGRVNVIAVDPSNANIIFAGTPAGGLWKSSNGGSSWTSVTDVLSATLGISGIAIDPSSPANSRTIYILTGDGDGSTTYSTGVFKSTDGGSTWNQTGLKWDYKQFKKGYKLIIHPSNNQTIFAATTDGIYKSTDGGASWGFKSGDNIFDIEFKPGAPSVMYACSRSYFYKSTDGGETWVKVRSVIGEYNQRMTLAVTPANPSYVYVLAGGTSIVNYFNGLYRSTDEGANFTLMSNSPNVLSGQLQGSSDIHQSWYDLAIAASPSNANEIHVGGINCWKSVNGGATWEITAHWDKTEKPTPGDYTHADIHALEFFGSTLYCGSDGGVFKSVNNAADWINISEGLAISEIYRISSDPNNANKIQCGLQDNGSNILLNGTLHQWWGGDGMECIADPVNSNIFYGSVQYGGLIKSIDNGQTMIDIRPPGQSGNWVTPFVMDPSNRNILYAGYGNIWKSTDAGATWSNISNGQGFANDRLAVAPSNGAYIYGSSYSSLYRTTNGGTSWQVISNSLPSKFITGILVSPTDPNSIWVTYGGFDSQGKKIFKTTNGGTNWTDITGTLPDIPVNCIVFQTGTNNGIYIGTDIGVFYKNDSMGDWIKFSDGLPNTIVMDIDIHYASGKLRVGTYGRGIWESSLYDIPAGTNSNPAAIITSPASNSNFNALSNITINATASDNDGTISKVEFYASGKKIGEDATSPYSIVWNNAVPNANDNSGATAFQVIAKAIDNGGGVGLSSPVNINVINNAPVCDITAPTSGPFAEGASVTMTATASDSDGSVKKVEFYIDANTKIGEDSTSPYSFVWSNLTEGYYYVSVKAIDNLGLIGYSLNSYSIEVTSANQTPTVTLTAPANNATYSAGANITVSANATDAEGAIKKVEFYNGSIKIGEDDTAPYSIVWQNVGPDLYNTSSVFGLTAKVYDDKFKSSSSNQVNITVNNAAPSISLTGPASGSTYSTGSNVTITANASDSDDGVSKVVFQYFTNGGPVVEIGVDSTAPYSIVWTNVPAGEYYIFANVFDSFGLNAASNAIAITVTGPANILPVTNITAPSTGNTFAEPATITVSANASDADGTISKVEFYANGNLIGTDNSTPYSIQWSNVMMGNYAITSKAFDNLNATTTSQAVTITVTGNARPVVTVTSPSNSATFTSPSTITINVTATDSDGTISKVEFYNGATKLGEDLTSPYSYTWNNVSTGAYSLTAVATDNQNGSTTSSAIAITVNNIPAVNITSPANNSTYTAGANVSIDATATDADGTISKVEFYQGTVKLSEDFSSPYSYTWNGLTQGSYALTAKAIDNLNGVATSSVINITVNGPVCSDPEWNSTQQYGGGSKVSYNGRKYTANYWNQNARPDQNCCAAGEEWTDNGPCAAGNVAPNVSITSPSNNAAFASGATVTINANANDSDGTVSKVEFYQGTTKLGEDLTSPYSYTWNSVASGAYALTAKAIDNLNASTTSGTVNIVVNNVPTASITSPVNNTSFASGTNITINATASDNDGTVSKVEFYQGSTKLGEDLSSPYSYVWNNVSGGSYALTVKAIDNLNGTFTSSVVNITVNALPTVSITAPSNNSIFAPGANITISANASDGDGTISKVEFYQGATKLGEDNTSPYSFAWNNVASGSYSLTVKAIDNLNGEKTSSVVSIAVTVAPTVSITSPVNNATFTAPANVSIDATASDSDGSISKVEFYQGATKLGEDNTSPYSYTWNSVAAGNYSLTAKAIDNLGAVTTSSAIAISVTGGGCSAPQYIENGGYIAGSRVKNNGTEYECKGFPYTSWCNGAAWAYAPGTGTNWSDAWIQIGACREGEFTAMDANALTMYPNPASQAVNMNYISENAGVITLTVTNELSTLILVKKMNVVAGDNYLNLNISDLNNGVYLLKIENEGRFITKKLSVVK